MTDDKTKRNEKIQHTSMGFSGTLLLLFIALKLTGHIDWAWVWVLVPAWWWAPVYAAMLILFGILWVGATIWDHFRRKSRLGF